MGVILISGFLAGVFVYSLIYFKFKYMFNIKGKTIHVQKPIVSDDNTTKRKPAINSEMLANHISNEAILRRQAYKNTSIKTGKSFFDDSDMESDYYLIIIYDRKLNTPLLTARYFFEKSVMRKYLKGDDNSQEQSTVSNTLTLDKFREGEIFFIDRMSANNSCSVYRKYRDYIHLLFYSELLTHNRNCKFIAMARKEKYEKLLAKYLRLGMRVAGSTNHKGKEHWILLGDLKKSYSQVKRAVVSGIILMFKILLRKTV